MSKKWIYEGEYRPLRDGEFTIGERGKVEPTVFRFGGDETVASFPILHPIPDDVVMVNRSLIQMIKIARNGRELTGDEVEQNNAAILSIIACAKPAKPKDEILEAMRMMDSWVESGAAFDVKRLKQAIALREKELKERGE